MKIHAILSRALIISIRNQSKRVLKFISIIAFICIILANLISFYNPAKGYELSIYEYTPFIVWFSIGICFVIAVIIIFHQVVTGNYKTSKFWMIGLLIFILTRITILSVPFTRGYFTWRGDHISHIGIVKDILFNGHITEGNFYPAEHIFLSTTQIITNGPVVAIVNQSPIIFSVLFLIYIYLFSTIIFPKKGQLLCLVAIGGVLFNDYHVFLRPNALALFMFPLPLYLFYKKSVEYRILLIIFLILYPFLHPNATLMLVTSFLAIVLSRKIFLRIHIKKKLRSEPRLRFVVPHFVITILIVVIVFILWLVYVPGYEEGHFLALFYKRLIALGTPHIDQASMDLDKIDLDALSLILLIIKDIGDEIIFAFSGIIAFFILRKSFSRQQFKKKEIILIDLIILIPLFTFLYIAFLFLPAFAVWGAARSLRYLEWVTPMFMGFILYKSLNLKRYSLLVCTIIICFILIASMISVIGLFRSPHVMRPSYGVTNMEVEGYEWYFVYKDEEVGNVRIVEAPYRFAHLILGKEVTDNRYDIMARRNIPDHFNYTSSKTLGESYDEDKYAVISKIDRIVYVTVWAKVGRFNNSDFQKLENDSTVNKIYSNGELDVIYIKAMRD